MLRGGHEPELFSILVLDATERGGTQGIICPVLKGDYGKLTTEKGDH